MLNWLSLLRIRPPRVGIAPGSEPGTLGLWIKWDPRSVSLHPYRWRISLANPFGKIKDGTFTYTLEEPLDTPFFQVVEVPATLRDLLDTASPGPNAIITIQALFVETRVVARDFLLKKVKEVYLASGPSSAELRQGLPSKGKASPDKPEVMSLDYAELVVHRRRVERLKEAAREKAARLSLAKSPTEVHK
jgi:hypothetical protein